MTSTFYLKEVDEVMMLYGLLIDDVKSSEVGQRGIVKFSVDSLSHEEFMFEVYIVENSESTQFLWYRQDGRWDAVQVGNPAQLKSEFLRLATSRLRTI